MQGVFFPCATFAAGLDRFRLARTRDLAVLVVRAIREAFQVMTALGIPITPPGLKIFQRLPEWILVPMLQKAARREQIEIALIGHARAARDEISAPGAGIPDLARSERRANASH